MSFRFQSQKDEMRTDQNKILKEAGTIFNILVSAAKVNGINDISRYWKKNFSKYIFFSEGVRTALPTIPRIRLQNLEDKEEKGASRDLWGAGGGDGGGDDADADEKITCSVSTWQLLHQMGQVEGGAQE